MRPFLIAGWLLLPVGAWAYHEGPGQDRIKLDAVDAELADARKAATAGEWALAAKHYDAALAALPQLETGEAERAAMRIRVSSAKAKLEGSKLIEAEKELSALVDELTEMDASYADLLEEAKEGHANTKFYITWLMRLEGYQRSDWEPEIESARQAYGRLAEQARSRGDEQRADEMLASLESAIKLARLDLDELQGLPLPSQ